MLALFWLDVHNLRTCGTELISQSNINNNSLQEKSDKDEHHNIKNPLDDRPPVAANQENNKNVSLSCDEQNPDVNSNTAQIKMQQCTCDNSNLSNIVRSAIPSDQIQECSNKSTFCIKCSSDNNSNFSASFDSSSPGDFGEFQCSSDLNSTSNERNKECNTTASDATNGNTDDLGCNNTVFRPVQTSIYSAPCPLRQQLVREVWRIYDRYIAIDADMQCPISELVKKDITKKMNKIHLHFDPECFNYAQTEAFELLERLVGSPNLVNSFLFYVLTGNIIRIFVELV